MADNYNPQVGIIQTSAHVAARIHAGSGDYDAWASTFETVLAALIEEVEDVDTKSAASTSGSVPRSSGNATPTLASPPSGNGDGLLSNDIKQNMWDYLWLNPKSAFDNYGDSRAKSGGGRGPDFKFRNDCGESSLKGEGLWADTMPSAFRTHEGTVEFPSTSKALDALRERING